MNDTNYPSGPWTGFYIQKRAKYRQDLALEFSNGKITGGGQDNIGQFVIAGRYDAANGGMLLEEDLCWGLRCILPWV